MLALRGGCRPLQPTRPTPRTASPAGCSARGVWAPPRSLAATKGILSVPRGTEMFQFPRCPPGIAPRCPAVRRAGCPIRTSPDRRLPAPPRGISPRGRVLPRPPTPRHPPCAHHADSCVRSHPAASCRGSRPARASGTSPPARARAATTLARSHRIGLGPTAPLTRIHARTGRRSASLVQSSVLACCELPVMCLMQCARAVRHETPRSTRRLVRSRGRRTQRVPRGALSRCRRPAGLPREVSDLPSRGRRLRLRSSNLVRSRLPTSDEVSQPARGHPDRGWPITGAPLAPLPGWSRGDSNPGPPPCKGGALPAKLRPPDALGPRADSAPGRVGAPGLEPGTSALSGPRSNHLSYAPAARRAARAASPSGRIRMRHGAARDRRIRPLPKTERADSSPRPQLLAQPALARGAADLPAIRGAPARLSTVSTRGDPRGSVPTDAGSSPGELDTGQDARQADAYSLERR